MRVEEKGEGEKEEKELTSNGEMTKACKISACGNRLIHGEHYRC